MAFRPRRASRPTYGGARPKNFNHGRVRNNSAKSSKQYIHPSKFINKAVSRAEEAPYESKNQFIDFPFGAQLKNNIIAKGYESTSPIQDQAIPYIIDGKDVVGLANTGTGKTAAFLLPLIERQSGLSVKPSVLVIAPTRELAMQIEEQFKDFARNLNQYSVLLVGGMPVDRQIRELKRRPDFVIGTPGRIKDLLNRGIVNLNQITAVVLDEADRMLDMGFLPDIRTILEKTPPNRQTLLFSATITPDITAIINQFTTDPVTVSVKKTETNEHIEQDVVGYRDKAHKIELLTEMLEKENYEKVLVFGETKFGVQRLSDHLDNRGIASVAIHGNKNQSQRQRALKQFKEGKIKVLVATDVAARGLDIPSVSHVINFDTPQTYEDYVHRIGRTGRAGAAGMALTFIEVHNS